ncbi:hypothetical protein ElyMa_001461100 [Elysia marginata]|uniref:Uncharacterized protein n=1 Tax=Elysia marginata TaxID=1093978 RepID=A0AAV4J117_9GAST|nr:hypothetical protein ElyMa_001461100 [Elysia marginata]
MPQLLLFLLLSQFFYNNNVCVLLLTRPGVSTFLLRLNSESGNNNQPDTKPNPDTKEDTQKLDTNILQNGESVVDTEEIQLDEKPAWSNIDLSVDPSSSAANVAGDATGDAKTAGGDFSGKL